RREHRPGDDRDAVLVGDDVDVLDVALRRHRRVDLDRHRHHRAVLGDQRDVELDDPAAVLHRLAAEHALERRVDGLVLSERLRPGRPRRQRHASRRCNADGAERPQHRPPRHPPWLRHRLPPRRAIIPPTPPMSTGVPAGRRYRGAYAITPTLVIRSTDQPVAGSTRGSGCSRTSSAASVGSRSYLPSAHRYSIVMFLPSTYPWSRSPRRRAFTSTA